jgi:DNA-binding MurR/RpiR family transcriptional regulator
MPGALSRGSGTAAPPAAAISAALGRRQLSAAHQRIAEYLARNTPESLFLSSPALAAAVGVSQPSVTRFARAAGYSGYADLQRQLRTLALGDPEARRTRANRYQAAVDDAIQTLHSLEASMADPRQIRAVGQQLARSRPLVVLSVRAGGPAATYFTFFAARVHPDVRLINAGGSMALDGITQARQSGASAALCFLMPRYPHEVLGVLRYVRESGMKAIVVTDRLTRVAARLGDVVLTAEVGGRLVFETYAAPIVMAGLLLQAMAEADPQRARARLADLERMFSSQRVFTGDLAPPAGPDPLAQAVGEAGPVRTARDRPRSEAPAAGGRASR